MATQLAAQVQAKDLEIEAKTREVGEPDRELHFRQTRIDQLTHEIWFLKRHQFGRRSEQFKAVQQ